MTQAPPGRPAPAATRRSPTDRLPTVAAVAGAAFYLGGGAWALVSPRSFYDVLAVFPAYNQHFIQDVGAFQLGLGATLVLALLPATRGDTLTVVLGGVGTGSVAHVVSHVIGIDLGGRPATDIPLLGLLALLLVAGAVVRWRAARGAAAGTDVSRPLSDPRG